MEESKKVNAERLDGVEEKQETFGIEMNVNKNQYEELKQTTNEHGEAITVSYHQLIYYLTQSK